MVSLIVPGTILNLLPTNLAYLGPTLLQIATLKPNASDPVFISLIHTVLVAHLATKPPISWPDDYTPTAIAQHGKLI